MNKALNYLLFDIWFIFLYQNHNVNFFDSELETKKHISSGIVKRRDLTYTSLQSFLHKTRPSGLCIEIDQGEEYYMNISIVSTPTKDSPHAFGIRSKKENNSEFLFLTIPSIPNTQHVLNEFFQNDIFFQDLITEGLNKKLYRLLKQFPFEVCLLITQYLRSIFYKEQKQKSQKKNKKTIKKK